MIHTGRRLFTSESVCMGHPDKLADQIADAILDEVLSKDPYGRVAAECLVKTGLAIVAGEITTTTYVDMPKVIRETIRQVGYTDATYGFDYETCGVLVCIEEQSPDIARGVNEDEGHHKDLGAGDQGIMFGYACDETPELMPLPITLARHITNRLAEVRQNGEMPYLRPDGKAQVTIEYEDNKPVRVHTVVVSAQHNPDVMNDKIREDIIQRVVKPVFPAELMDKKVIYHINPTGRFVVGGPQGDSGLTGRKIIVDTYGGMGHHGGGSFSGKDPTKVDRSASYAARYAAKNIVASGLARRCEVQLSYAIGISEPLSIAIETYGTGKVSEGVLEKLLRAHFIFSPSGMIKALNLRRPIYLQTARYGHFGRTGADYAWEKTDKAEALRKAAGV